MKQFDRVTEYFKCQFMNLNRNTNSKGEYAPHKPVLLLAIIDLVEKGSISSNRIELTDELIQQFKTLWERHVPHLAHFNPDVTKPFYHMHNEPFWSLALRDYENTGYCLVAEDGTDDRLGCIPSPRYSIRFMRTTFECAFIDRTLFLLMQDHDSRCELRNVLFSLLLNTMGDDRFVPTKNPFSIYTKLLVVRGDLLTGNARKIIKKSSAA